jgi:imidazole glycerol phosphate synthase subunit HisF
MAVSTSHWLVENVGGCDFKIESQDEDGESRGYDLECVFPGWHRFSIKKRI